jgi:hypothetical protein
MRGLTLIIMLSCFWTHGEEGSIHLECVGLSAWNKQAGKKLLAWSLNRIVIYDFYVTEIINLPKN